MAPRANWPSAPMFHIWRRKAIATPREHKKIGMALIRQSSMDQRDPKAPWKRRVIPSRAGLPWSLSMKALTASESSMAAKKTRQELHGRGSCLL